MNQLRMQMKLLVAFNGRQRVLEELASVEGLDLATVERELAEISSNAKPKAAAARRPRQRKSVHDLIRDVPLDDEVRPLVEKLAVAYEARGFLPELWRVKQFLESKGIDGTKTRSRNDAFPKVLSVLSGLSRNELELLEADLENRASDLSILTDQILGPTDGYRHGQGAQRRPAKVTGQSASA